MYLQLYAQGTVEALDNSYQNLLERTVTVSNHETRVDDRAKPMPVHQITPAEMDIESNTSGGRCGSCVLRVFDAGWWLLLFPYIHTLALES